MTALLIAIVVALAVGITIQRANAIARNTVNASISSAAKLFKDLERQRLGRLALSAHLIGTDPTFAAYMQSNLMAADLVSINDQLNEKHRLLGSDVVMLLDNQEKLVSGTDQPSLTHTRGDDLYKQSPLVKKAIDSTSSDPTSGVFVYGNKLYHAAVVPIGAGATPVRVGYLVNAYAIDDAFANKIAEWTRASVGFISKVGGAPARSSDAPSVGMQQMQGVKQTPMNTTIDSSKYVVVGEPLMSANVPVGWAVFLRS